LIDFAGKEYLMFTDRFNRLLLAVGCCMLVAACSTPVPLEEKKDVPVETRNPTGTGAGQGAAQQPAAQSQVATVDLSKSAAGLTAAQRIVYFDFDSFVIKDEYKSVVEANAKVLSANRAKRLVVEGHTDERGGREYNLALGQKRAEAVARALVLAGATDAQLEAVSFGKERPAASGSDEAAWAKNRRAELKDR
jgi:peptidoglycan-associated lipoprotein